MNQPKLLLKIVVLSGFVLLLGSFTAYRAGVLNRFAGNKALINAGIEVDSPSYRSERMSGSKSAAVFRPAPVKPKDSVARQQNNAPQQQKVNQQTNRPANNEPNQH